MKTSITFSSTRLHNKNSLSPLSTFPCFLSPTTGWRCNGRGHHFLSRPSRGSYCCRGVFHHWKFAISKQCVRARLIFCFMKYLKTLRKLLERVTFQSSASYETCGFAGIDRARYRSWRWPGHPRCSLASFWWMKSTEMLCFDFKTISHFKRFSRRFELSPHLRSCS